MAKIYLLILLFLPSLCMGDMYFHLNSYHPSTQDLNNNTFGMGIKSKSNIYGFYRNSYKKLSPYAVKQKRLMPDFSLVYGLVLGYEKPILPVVGLEHAIDNISLIYTPPTKINNSAIMLSVKF